MKRTPIQPSYLRHIHACNPPIQETFEPWCIAGQVVGWIRPAMRQALLETEDVFRWRDGCLHLVAGENFTERTQALNAVVEALVQAERIDPLMGEPYPVTPAGREDALCVLDRAAAAWFGIRAFGQHLNGYVRKADGIHMWIGRRAADRLIFPNHLDNMVAGGLPWGISLQDNLIKEGQEEAGLSREQVQQARITGVITYNRITEKGLRPDVLYCYDLELSEDFQPRNSDGEVASFHLLPLAEVARLVRETNDFKLNCNLVIIDFLLRHGFLQPEHPEYLELNIGLHPPLGIDEQAGVGF